MNQLHPLYLKLAANRQIILTFFYNLAAATYLCTHIYYLYATFAIDRTQSGIVDFNPAFPCATTAPCPTGAELHLRLFFDHSSVELFESEGRFAMTNILFPSEPYDTLRLFTAGEKAKVEKVVIYKMGE